MPIEEEQGNVKGARHRKKYTRYLPKKKRKRIGNKDYKQTIALLLSAENAQEIGSIVV